jgi:hypothetical protein
VGVCRFEFCPPHQCRNCWCDRNFHGFIDHRSTIVTLSKSCQNLFIL